MFDTQLEILKPGDLYVVREQRHYDPFCRKMRSPSRSTGWREYPSVGVFTLQARKDQHYWRLPGGGPETPFKTSNQGDVMMFLCAIDEYGFECMPNYPYGYISKTGTVVNASLNKETKMWDLPGYPVIHIFYDITNSSYTGYLKDDKERISPLTFYIAETKGTDPNGL